MSFVGENVSHGGAKKEVRREEIVEQEQEQEQEEGPEEKSEEEEVGGLSSSASTDRLHDPAPLTKTVVLYENERYQMSALSWSKNGLLPTDRKHISTRNGKHGWATLEAADMGTITHGWTWTQSSWSIDQDGDSSSARGSDPSSGGGSDGEGWVYAASFGSIEESGSARKGMTHFVRRRRRSRQQTFLGPSLVAGTCDHCDTEQLQMLSDCLLEALTQTSLHENPGEYSSVVTDQLKDTLLELLGLASRGETFHDMAGALQVIDKFFISVINKKSAWAKLSSIVGADYLPEKLPERAVEVSSFSFPLEERREVARMLIRKYDTSFTHHCHRYNCGADCTFALTPCPSLGCSEVLSALHMERHLVACSFALLDCERGCGELVARKEMSCHVRMTCVQRPAECPYACIGCTPAVGLTVASLSQHVADPEQIHVHLSLALDRLAEQQSVIVSLNKKVIGLESSVSIQGRAIKLLQGGAAATLAAIKSAEQTAEQVSHREMQGLEQRLEQRAGSVTKRMEALDKNIRSVERENTAQKAQLETALLNQAEGKK